MGNHSDRFVDLQTRLGSEDHVRVRGRFGEVVTRRPTLTTDSLLAAPDSAGRPGAHVSLHDVTSIQVLGGAAGTGALVGAGVGVGGGLAVSTALSASLCSDGGCANEYGAVPHRQDAEQDARKDETGQRIAKAFRRNNSFFFWFCCY